MRSILQTILRMIDKPRFSVGDLVLFDPDERAIGWTQDMHGLYPGYIGHVTNITHGGLFEWGIYVDYKPIEFLDRYFRLVERRRAGDESA